MLYLSNSNKYLTERFVVLGLLEDVQQAVVLQLYKTPRLETPYLYKLGKAIPQIVVDGHTKPLSELLGSESLFLFDKFKLIMFKMKWILKNPSTWELFPVILKRICTTFSCGKRLCGEKN